MIGDCFGAPYEGRYVTGNKVGTYTDDTEQAYGIALWLKSKKHTKENLETMLKKVFTGHSRGYGNNQAAFLKGEPHRSDSFGNGSSMRVAPVGEYGRSVEEVIQLATLQSQLTHNHPDALAGAVTIALLTYLAKTKQDPYKIRSIFPKALLPIIGKKYICSLEARESIPPAVDAFLQGKSFEDVLEKALSYGGDTDTIAAMACGIASMKFNIPKTLIDRVKSVSKDNQVMINKIMKFN